MAEPSSATAAGVVVAAGTITLTGSIFGLQYDALLFGFCGGLVSLMFLSPDSPTLRTTRATAGMLFAAAFLAALFSPGAAPGLHALAEWTEKIPADTIRLASAGLIGLCFQFVIPLGLKWAASRAGS